MKIDVHNNDTKIVINEKSLEFPVPIARFVKFKDFVVLRLKTTDKDHKYGTQNILAFNSDATTKWKISKGPPEGTGYGPRGAEFKSYTGLWKEGDDLWVHNSAGWDYRIDKDDGSIIEKKFTR